MPWFLPALRVATVLLLPALSGGCLESLAVTAAVGVAAVPLIGRTPPDLLISTIAGQDCSLVRLDAGKSYCKPVEQPPARPLVCTRSLGVVDCWTNPEALGAPFREVADGARSLTPVQEAHRTRWGPGWLREAPR